MNTGHRGWLIALMAPLLVGACAAGGQGSSLDGKAGSSSSSSSPEPQPQSGAAAAATAPGDGRLGRPMAGPGGRVSVRLARHSFGEQQMIRAWVVNGTKATVYVEDLHTGCSVAVVERRAAGSGDWTALPDCGAERAAAVLAIGASRGRLIRIDPAGLAAAGQPLTPGRYRIAVPWGTSGDSGDTSERAFSGSFEVR